VIQNALRSEHAAYASFSARGRRTDEDCLLRRISTWLEDDGKAFIHVFSHRTLPYLFEGTWAARRFFTAGLMPSHDPLPRFQEQMAVADSWIVPGTHDAKTLRARLARLDASAEHAVELLMRDGRSPREARRLVACWRLFLLSTDEIWSYCRGNRWLVSHYLLEPLAVGLLEGSGKNPDVRLMYSS